MRINRGTTKNLGFVTDKKIWLKNWHPVRRDRRQTYLGSPSLVATTLPADLGNWSEEMEVKGEEKNRQQKNNCRQTAGIQRSLQ